MSAPYYSADGVSLTVDTGLLDPDGVTLRCGCCGLPWARLVDGALVVESRHGGAVHVNTVSVAALAALAPGNGATNGETWGYSG